MSAQECLQMLANVFLAIHGLYSVEQECPVKENTMGHSLSNKYTPFTEQNFTPYGGTFHSPHPNAAYMRQWTGSALV